MMYFVRVSTQYYIQTAVPVLSAVTQHSPCTLLDFAQPLIIPGWPSCSCTSNLQMSALCPFWQLPLSLDLLPGTQQFMRTQAVFMGVS